MKKIFLYLTLALTPMGVVGCAHTATAPVPPLVNAVNAFDETSYRALVTLQGSLNSLRTSIAADPTNLSSLKPALNQAIGDYNIAESAWKIYHSSQSNQQDVTDTLNKAQSDVSKLQTAVRQ